MQILKIVLGIAIILNQGSTFLFAQGANVTISHSDPIFTPMLDPDSDGFISESGAAFTSTTTEAAEFEILANSVTGWVEIFNVNEADSDVTPSCSNVDIAEDGDGGDMGWSNIVDPTPGSPRSGDEYLLLRMRIGDSYSGNFGYNFLLSTDGLYGSSIDPNAVPGNQGFEYEIQFSSGGNKKGVSGWDIDGLTAPTTLNCNSCIDIVDVQESAAAIAGGCTAGSPTFITFAFDFSFLPVSMTSSIEPADLFIALATAASGNNTSILGGGNVKDYGAFDDNAPPAGCTGTGAAYFDCLMDAAFATQQAALPVSLIRFEAKSLDVGNRIHWSVAEEHNLDVYELEYSTDAVTFTTLTSIKAIANDLSGVFEYSYTQEKPAPTTYYRLRRVDFDGYTELSSVVVVQRASQSWSVFPNPIAADMEQVLNLTQGQSGTHSLFDVYGRKLITYYVSDEDTSILLPSLHPGNYILLNEDHQSYSRIMAQ